MNKWGVKKKRLDSGIISPIETLSDSFQTHYKNIEFY